jgi:hypothetical protein
VESAEGTFRKEKRQVSLLFLPPIYLFSTKALTHIPYKADMAPLHCRTSTEMTSRHAKRLKQDVPDDEAALSGQDTADEMDQCPETSRDKEFVDDSTDAGEGGVEDPSPTDEGGTVGEAKAEPLHRVLNPGWVDATTVLELLPEEGHRKKWEQKVGVVGIGGGAEIAFFKALTQGHNRSVDTLAQVLGTDMTTFLQTFILVPILRQGKSGFYANFAVFNGSRKQWVGEVIRHLSVPCQHRPDLTQPLCE